MKNWYRIPWMLFIVLALAAESAFCQIEKKTEEMVTDFKDREQLSEWQIINDGVMGGVSSSEIVIGARSVAVFQGYVSLENNGGFASVRLKPRELDLGEYAGISVRVRGDGRTYQFRLGTNDAFDGISYRVSFKTQKDVWEVHYFPFPDFKPTYRGRYVENANPLAREKIQQVGVLIADKREGPFLLEIDWIKGYREGNSECSD